MTVHSMDIQAEKEGWDEYPFRVLIVKMAEIANMGSISMEVIDFFTDEVYVDPSQNFPLAVEQLTADVVADDPDTRFTWDPTGFDGAYIGIMVIVEGYANDENHSEQRQVIFYSPAQGFYATTRIRGQEPESQWFYRASADEDPLLRALRQLTELGFYVMVRNRAYRGKATD